VAAALAVGLFGACGGDPDRAASEADAEHAPAATPAGHGEHDDAGHDDHGEAEHGPGETGGGEHAAGGHDGEHAGHSEGPPRIALAAVRGVGFITVGPPREEGAWFPAEAEAEETAEAALTAPVGGIVSGLFAAPGERVARGAPVVAIESPELAALRAAYLTARARAAQAESDLARERRLAEVAATSERELEAAAAAAAVAAAEVEAARLALAARGADPDAAGAVFRVRAPASGVLARLAVVLGEGVEAGRELGRVMAGDARRVRVELPLPGPQAWAPGAETEVRRADGHRWTARVEGVPAALSPETRRLSWRLRLTGGEPLLPGTPVEVRVPLAVAVVLPQQAVQRVEGDWGVFVRDGEEAVFRPVRRGAELGGDVMVLEGVAPGEEVAHEGAYLLKSLHLQLSGGGERHEH
jgi:cobalt-zinc-cadmium efflux system membrane fusion protein